MEKLTDMQNEVIDIFVEAENKRHKYQKLADNGFNPDVFQKLATEQKVRRDRALGMLGIEGWE